MFLSDSAGSDDGMDGLRMSSITYRVATGKHAGRKVLTLQTLPGDEGPLEGGAGQVGGFSLHAGVAAEAHESDCALPQAPGWNGAGPGRITHPRVTAVGPQPWRQLVRDQVIGCGRRRAWSHWRHRGAGRRAAVIPGWWLTRLTWLRPRRT